MWNRCNALYTWVVNKSPYLWLKPSSEAKVWVQDLFRRPQAGPMIAEAEVSMPHASESFGTYRSNVEHEKKKKLRSRAAVALRPCVANNAIE